MKKIGLVAIDLDGTLLNSAKEITDTTAAVLRAAREEAGVRIVLASARPPRSVLPFYRLLGLDTPMVNYNGALVMHPGDGRVLSHLPIPARAAREIIVLARQIFPEVVVSAEVMDRSYTDRVDPAYNTETGQLFGPDVVAPVHEWADQAMTKLLLLGEGERLGELALAVAERFAGQVAMVQTEDVLLQIMHAEVSKARALATVAADLNVPRGRVMAIGDNANDVGMLKWAAIGVAMANAAPDALAAADYITDHHDADGAAHAIRRLIFLGHAPGQRPAEQD